MATPDESGARYPTVEIIEEGMREGMQIEDADIPVSEKVRLLDSLSRTGLSTIVVGSFVSPKWTPQMRLVDEVVQRFTPAPRVKYTALALNEQGRERMAAYTPPLSPPVDIPYTNVHLCDVFVRRNTNRSVQDEIDAWPTVVAEAARSGVTEAGIGINAAWGSNWLGPFTEEYRLDMLDRQHQLWTDAGIKVTRVKVGDPMGWNVPSHVRTHLRNVQHRWPQVNTFHLHLHDARGTALTSAYTAIEALDPSKTLVLDTSIGGMGGCPYGGHGRMTRMIPTEDLVDLLNELGIPNPVDLDALIDSALLAEEVVGHPLWGHVSKAGPRPRDRRLFPMDLPFIETEQEAQHFRLGPSAHPRARSPWARPIESPARPA